MASQIQLRAFLVGCPRSGTTVLQSMLAAHPRIASFPETHFFVTLAPFSTWRRVLGLASRKPRPRFMEFLEQFPDDALSQTARPHAWSMRRQAAEFMDMLDRLAEQQGGDRWVEKTPDHLRVIPLIEKYVPGARFIHLVRAGADVVASLYDVTQRFPETWGGAWPIQRCIDKWNTDIGCTRRELDKSNHVVVQYERLVESPHSVLAELCGFLGVTFDPCMLSGHQHVAGELTTPHEPWKRGAQQPLAPCVHRKFERLFDDDERRYILERLDPARDLLDSPGKESPR
jgi:hypothetical protein